MQDKITSPPADILSRPIYRTLQPAAHAQWNLIVAQGRGMESVLRMLNDAPLGFSARAHVIYLASGDNDNNDYLEQLESFGPISINRLETRKATLERLAAQLKTAKMGTRLYAVGGESFLGLVIREASQYGVHHESVVTELNGSLARRVQCVHCKYIAEPVTTNVYNCPRCQETLEVRDHYSRRLAAFQGVAATIEAPGVELVREEVYV